MGAGAIAAPQGVMRPVDDSIVRRLRRLARIGKGASRRHGYAPLAP